MSKKAIVQPVADLPAPKVIGDLALCQGTTSITIGNLVGGATVRIFVDDEEIGIAGAPFASQFAFPVPPIDGATVTAQQSLCKHWSPLSKPATVVEGEHDLPTPIIPEPLYECGGAVRVEGVKRVWVTVHSELLNAPIGEAFAGGSSHVDVKVSPLLIAGDHISATIKACGDESQRSEPVTVEEHPAVHSPQIVHYVIAHSTAVKVDHIIPGAFVEIFVDGFWRGGSYATTETATIPILSELVVDQLVAARQRICDRVSDLGANATVIPPAPVAMFTAEPSSGEAPLMVQDRLDQFLPHDARANMVERQLLSLPEREIAVPVVAAPDFSEGANVADNVNLDRKTSDLSRQCRDQLRRISLSP